MDIHFLKKQKKLSTLTYCDIIYFDLFSNETKKIAIQGKSKLFAVHEE